VARIASTKEPIVENIIEMTRWALKAEELDKNYIGIALDIPVEKIKACDDEENQERELKTYHLFLLELKQSLDAQIRGCCDDEFGLHIVDTTDMLTIFASFFGLGRVRSSYDGFSVAASYLNYLGRQLSIQCQPGFTFFKMSVDWRTAVRVRCIVENLLLLPWNYVTQESLVACLTEIFSEYSSDAKSLLKNMYDNPVDVDSKELQARILAMQCNEDVMRKYEAHEGR